MAIRFQPLKPLWSLSKCWNTPIPQPTQKAPERTIVIHWFPWNVTRLPAQLVSFSVTLTLTGLEGLALPWQVYTATGSKSINGISAMNDGNPKEMKCPTVFPSFGRDYIIFHQKHLKPVPLASHKRHDGPPSPLYLGATHPAISGNHWLWITTCTWPRCFIQIAGVMEGSPWFTSPSIWPISHGTSYRLYPIFLP